MESIMMVDRDDVRTMENYGEIIYNAGRRNYCLEVYGEMLLDPRRPKSDFFKGLQMIEDLAKNTYALTCHMMLSSYYYDQQKYDWLGYKLAYKG